MKTICLICCLKTEKMRIYLNDYTFCTLNLAKMSTFGTASKYQARVEHLAQKAIADRSAHDFEDYFADARILELIKAEDIESLVKASGIAAKSSSKKAAANTTTSDTYLRSQRNQAPTGRSDLLGPRDPNNNNKRFKRIHGRCDSDTRQRICKRGINCKFLHPWADKMKELFGQ